MTATAWLIFSTDSLWKPGSYMRFSCRWVIVEKNVGHHETDHRQYHRGRGHANALLVEALHTVANPSKRMATPRVREKTDENRSDDGGLSTGQCDRHVVAQT